MQSTTNIVADESIWGVEAYFSQINGCLINKYVLAANKISHARLLEYQADVLLTRSSVQVNASMLAGTNVSFVATATVGDDHIDKEYLQKQGIVFASAAGSSTDSVVEYMLAALLWLDASEYMPLTTTTLGIIGAGRIGSKTALMAKQLDMAVLCNDPPRARQETGAQLVELDYLLAHADIISLHTPLTNSGKDATKHLIDAAALAYFGEHGGYGLINAGRGALVDNKALLTWLNANEQRFAILDCWENEPNPLPELLHHQQVLLATPHIAGHSLDGKANNTQYIYDALCQYLGIIEGTKHKVKNIMQTMQLNNIARNEKQYFFNSLATVISYLYDIKADDIRMRTAMPLNINNTQQAVAFRQLRKFYPVRRGWNIEKLAINNTELAKQAAKIGIACA
ncbi:MAG: 4-phosphoerythronate dehydrogenase [Mariprofundales bacterium]